METLLKSAALAASVFVAFSASCGFVWFAQANDLASAKIFDPKRETIRRETFEESKAYNDGMLQDLRREQSEYIRAKPEQKATLASVIRSQFAAYDRDRLPSDLRSFLTSLESN